MIFQSTLPMRGATCIITARINGGRDFNPRSPCGERLTVSYITFLALTISIHAPHAGSDNRIVNLANNGLISIHAPHAGSDWMPTAMLGCLSNFNPRSPCGERRDLYRFSVEQSRFQSTLPMRGATRLLNIHFLNCALFQSTLPMRGATVKQKTLNPCGIQHIILRTS